VGSGPRQGLNVVLMGVVNVTPDSFSDGFLDGDTAIDHGLRLLDEGADWLDIGGESTRPGSAPVDAPEELRRVIPVIAGLAKRRPRAVLSVDTSKAEVARAAIDAGATVVNDVTALGDDAMAGLVARTGVTLVLMHMRGQPATMQRDTGYVDLVAEIRGYLGDRAAIALAAGIPRERILVDPGLGFGKDPADNPRLVKATPEFRSLGHRVVIGASRKSFVGKLTGVTRPQDRVYGSIGAALAAAEAGADVLRVHDVRATREALAVYCACRGEVCRSAP
jgi:dihydropteroate synthase